MVISDHWTLVYVYCVLMYNIICTTVALPADVCSTVETYITYFFMSYPIHCEVKIMFSTTFFMIYLQIFVFLICLIVIAKMFESVSKDTMVIFNEKQKIYKCAWRLCNCPNEPRWSGVQASNL